MGPFAIEFLKSRITGGNSRSASLTGSDGLTLARTGMPVNGSNMLLVVVRENLCRPYGTRLNFPLYPVVKHWAKIFRPFGTPA